MKTIVAGGRDFDDYHFMEYQLDALPWKVCEIVSGAARGADALGESYAKAYDIPLKQFKADWSRHGNSAGYKRNIEMAHHADALVAFWDGKSKGTAHMIDSALKAELTVKVIYYNRFAYGE